MAEFVNRMQTTRVASGNLDNNQYTFVRQLGNLDVLTIPTSGAQAIGVLQNKPRDNEHAELVFLGSTKIRVANSLGAGIFVMAAVSGFAVAAASGPTNVVLGQLVTGATSGAVGELHFNPSSPGSL